MAQQRHTPTKAAVIGVLQQSPLPLCLNEIHHRAQVLVPSLAFSTVYRIVRQLVTTKQAVANALQNKNTVYEWADRPHHHHITCELCGLVADINDRLLNYSDAAVRTATGFIVRDHSIELTGICHVCDTHQHN